MKKTLILGSLLAIGALFAGSGVAYANPEPQQKSDATLTVRGIVVDENGEPVVGATVVEKGTRRATNTDVDGAFSLKVAPGATVVVNFVGYNAVEAKATPNMTIELKGGNVLDEVVAVAYGTQKRVNVTGAVATVDIDKTMSGRSQTDVAKALQGAVPGLTVLNGNGDINSNAEVKIRGRGTLTDGATLNPLYVVDGVPMDDISYLNPAEIEEISVLKDAASTSIYGSRAAFGVILINTKGAKKVDRISINYNNNFSWSQATVLPDYGKVTDQIRAFIQVNQRAGTDPELFGIYQDKMLPYAEAWEAQNPGVKLGYGEMRPFVSMDNVGDFYVDENGKNAMYYANWDVAGIMFNNAAPGQSHNISLSGSSGETNFYAGFGYSKKQGLMTFNPEKLQRYNANLSVSTKVLNFLELGARMNYTNRQFTEPNTARNTYLYMWRWGSYFGPYGTTDGVDYRNEIAYRKQAGDINDTFSLIRMQAWIKAHLFKGFTLNADYTLEENNRNKDWAYLPVVAWQTWSSSRGLAPATVVNQSQTYARELNAKDMLWTTNVYGNYSIDLSGHHINVMAGFNADHESYRRIDIRKNALLDNDLPFIGLTSGDIDWNNSRVNSPAKYSRATAGFFGRINYDYKGIYLLELNGRYDGSSKFPASKQWAFFPSMSLGYRFSEEAYFENLRQYINNGKLRFSYGEIGNQGVGNNRFISTVSSIPTYWLDGNALVTAYGMPTLVRPSLTWETVRTMDVGLDLMALNNRLSFSFDWFQRETLDMLAPGVTLPATLGADAPYANNGSLRTRGWELSVGYRDHIGDVDFYATFGIGDNTTKVTEWNNPTKILSSYYTGQQLGDIWGFRTDRYFTQDDFNADGSYKKGIADQSGLSNDNFVFGPGDIKFVDQNNDGKIDGGKGTADDHGDLVVIGNSLPRYEYSFHLGGAYKGFDLDLFFQGVGKRNLWTTSAFVMPYMRGADATYANQTSYNKIIYDEANHVIGYEINQNNDFPCLYPGNAGVGTISGIGNGCHNFYPQDKYLLNLSYLRLKNVTLGYTIPQLLSRKAFIEKARIYFSADNLCLLKGKNNYYVDPEVTLGGTANYNGDGSYGRTYPIMRTFSFGIQVTF